MKTRRLSEKKIHITCDMDISVLKFDSHDEISPEILIETFSSRFVYRKIKDANTPWFTAVGIYQDIEIYYAVIKPRFIADICNRYRIKSKFVLTPQKEIGKIFEVDVDGEKVNVVFQKILFTDPNWHTAWNRDRLIKSLLE